MKVTLGVVLYHIILKVREVKDGGWKALKERVRRSASIKATIKSKGSTRPSPANGANCGIKHPL